MKYSDTGFGQWNSGHIPVHIYRAGDNAENLVRTLREITRNPSVQGPVVLLPDHHHKPNLETPSSSVVLTRRLFCLALSSPSQNCGMSVLKTTLFSEDLSPARIEMFMNDIRDALPLRPAEPKLEETEVWQALQYGAAWAINRYDMPNDTSDGIEFGGALRRAREASAADIAGAVPPDVLQIAQYRFGVIGGGNHFLELQSVDEILDAGVARRWGLREHQVVIMLHTGSDAVGAYLGRLYARRKKTPMEIRLFFLRQRVRHHLMHQPLKGMLERISYYFMPGSLRFIDSETAEGKRVLLSVDCAANYGFASRVSIFRAMDCALRKATGNRSMDLRLLYDCSHNSIYKETIDGAEVWAHRHNACRACPPGMLDRDSVFYETGTPVLLPGTNRVSSYICAARAGIAATHYTVDHGLGALQSRAASGQSLHTGGGQVSLFSYDRESPTSLPLLADDAVSAAVGLLHDANIVKPVVRLKPLATLKGPKSKVV